MRSSLALIAVLSFGSPLFAHGGQFRGPPQGGPPPGLPSQPTKPARTGKVPHSWLTWWSYNQHLYVDFRRRQRERRGAITGTKQTDPDAWRRHLRIRLEPLMVAALRDDDKEVRTAAAVALGKFGARAAIPAIQKMIRTDSVQEAREAGLQGLLLMSDPQLRPFFTKIVEKRGEKLRLRGFALMGLGRIADAPSKDYLLRFFDPAQKRHRAILPRSTIERRQFLVAVLAALQMTGDKTLADTFLRYAKSKRYDEDVRAYALTCVGKMKAKGMLGELTQILAREPNEQVRRSAAVAIGALAPKLDETAVEALSRAISRDKDKIVRHFAIISLGQVGGPHAFKQLKRYYRYADKESRSFFQLAFGLSRQPEAAPLLKKTLEGAADANEAAAAAVGFGLLGDRTHAPTVRARFENSKAWILLQTTTLALGMLNDQKAAKPIRELLVTKKQPTLRMAAALAFALLRQHEAVPLFVDLLKRSRSILMLTAITKVMGYLASPAAATALEEVYADTKLQRQVRAFALVALGTLADTADYPVLVWLGFHINYFVRCDPIDEAVTIL